MKKIILSIVLVITILSLTACRSKDLTANNSTAKNTTAQIKTTVVTDKNMAGSPAITTIPATEQNSSKTETSAKPAISLGKTNPNAKTYTGYDPLPSVKFTVSDPENSRGLSTKKIEFSFGVAKNGIPHSQTILNQNYFDQKGFDALAYDKKSKEKVLYLTFDCGYENGYTGKILDILKDKKVPAAFFCTLDHIKAEPQLIARMIKEGHIVGNHSSKHPSFAEISRTRMAQEIQDCDNYLRANFGYSAPFFRFPKGEYSDSALDLVQSLHYKSIFWSSSYADWDIKKTKGKQYAFDTVTTRLHPGAVILLHSVSPDNAAALGDIINWARAQGYVFKSLI